MRTQNNINIISALIKKEFFQIIRDPSSIIIAFVIPLTMLLIYMYGINVDTIKVVMGVKNDDNSIQTQELIKSFEKNRFIDVIHYKDYASLNRDLVRSKIQGAVVIGYDYSRNPDGQILVLTDGSEANSANYVQSYSLGIISNYMETRRPMISTETRFWFNPEIKSRNFILPGAIAVNMTLIGILLSALVVAREWERGTMESLLSVGVSRLNLVISKYIPYFILGFLSFIFNSFLCIFIFKIPFLGNIFVLLSVGALFLFASIGIGLLISTALKDQFLASQAALAVGFLPALMLSGMIFPINSMPLVFQYITLILPVRYFVSFIESEFMAGTIEQTVLINSVYLGILGGLLFLLVLSKTPERLDQ